MSESSIEYFDGPGKCDTDRVLDAVVRRLDKGGINLVIIASSTGETARKILDRVRGRDVHLVVVTSHCGFEEVGECEMSQSTVDDLTGQGVKVVRASHALSGIERSITRRFGGVSRVEVISEALRSLFGQGMKVCVEIAVMAADSGVMPCGEIEAIVVGGSGDGADTACVLRPAHANRFFDMEIREVLAMPRLKGD
jgi:hypothetical protein